MTRLCEERRVPGIPSGQQKALEETLSRGEAEFKGVRVYCHTQTFSYVSIWSRNGRKKMFTKRVIDIDPKYF